MAVVVSVTVARVSYHVKRLYMLLVRENTFNKGARRGELGRGIIAARCFFTSRL